MPKSVANISRNEIPPKSAHTPQKTAVFFSSCRGDLVGNAAATVSGINAILNKSEYITESCGKNIAAEYAAISAADSASLRICMSRFKISDDAYTITVSIRKFIRKSMSI